MGRHLSFDPDVALEAAMAVFCAKGFEGTTIDDLEHATGLRRPSLYRRFGPKESFFRHAFLRFEATRLRYFRTALRRVHIRDVLKDLVTGNVDSAVLAADSGPTGFLAILSGAPCCEAIRDFVERRRRFRQWKLERRISIAIQTGQLRSDVDSVDLARLISITLSGMSVQAATGCDGSAIRGAANLMLDTLMERLSPINVDSNVTPEAIAQQ
ncbi:MAG: TetR/AcrR family transcriptional regulator [Sphingobium sp.]|uniref:TetR/AcrR family transcriptional regulator n=1 Tax=Sphingomonas melonis TaxID=152682 RepID=UPI000363096B|nr:TetR family transcriptional regulator [Sphingomonas melonis]MBS47103.1 TetR/AcrR family transcriptional regulator [Sphingobium sp.]|tara:strand:- start:502 stop:1137 length:636 start_codon:yes stop_codon:yes gene_type:complete